MSVSIAGRWLAVSCLVLLAACGGGGGGGGGLNAGLTFSPTTVTTSVQQDEMGTLTETVTIRNPAAITGGVWVLITDPQQVLTGGVNIASIDDAHFSATLHSSPALTVGHHRGSFDVHLCKDQACTQEWAGVSTLQYDIDVEAAPLHAMPTTATDSTIAWKATDHDVVQIAVTGGGQWTATSGASWLVVAAPGSGSSSAAVNVSFATEQLAQGDYASNVTVASTDGQSVVVPVTLHVIAPQFVIDAGGSPSFTAVNGAPIAPQAFVFELDNGTGVPWALNSDAAWLSASATAGMTPASLTLSADPSVGALATGSHDATLTLTSSGVTSKAVPAHLQLLHPTLATAVPSITLGGTRGRDLASTQTVLVTLNTGANSYPVTMSSPPAWLSISPTQAVIGQAGTTLTVGANAANVTAGSTSQAVVLTSTINGDTVTTPLTVNLNADQRRLLASTWGVGFASTPTGTVLTRTLTIRDNFAGSLAWTATSDSAWLSASASGTTGGASSLVLTANPASLPSETTSLASVTVATTTPGVSPATIRVALWKSATGATTVTSLAGVNATTLVADKIRPLVYASSGATDIKVYNAYTASVVATIPNVGSALGQMAVSPDGSRLYVLDTATKTMKVVDLDARAVVASWTLARAVAQQTNVVAIRPNGAEVVLLGDGTAYSNAHQVGATSIVGQLTATDDGAHAYSVQKGISSSTVIAWDLDYSEVAGGTFYAAQRAFTYAGGFEGDVAVAGDGSALYNATGSPYACQSIDPVHMAMIGLLPSGNPYPNNVEVTSSNQVVCGLAAAYNPSDFMVYSPAGALVGSYQVAGYGRGLKEDELVVTPDGFIVVTQTDDPKLAFVPIAH